MDKKSGPHRSPFGKSARWYGGFLGFLGINGFRYFSTAEPRWLFWFAYFAFFAYFWIARLRITIPDERYLENSRLALAFVGQLALMEMAVLIVLSTLLPYQELYILGIAIVWASLLVSYAVKLYHLEER